MPGPGPRVAGLSRAADLPVGLPSWLFGESLRWLPGSPLVVRTGGGSRRAGMELRGRGWLPAAKGERAVAGWGRGCRRAAECCAQRAWHPEQPPPPPPAKTARNPFSSILPGLRRGGLSCPRQAGRSPEPHRALRSEPHLPPFQGSRCVCFF